MLFLQFALPAEAQPFIETYALQQTGTAPFSLYQNDTMALVISGIGRDAATQAATFLLTRFKATPRDSFVNLGICAAAPEWEIGSALVAHTLLAAGERPIYPDMRYRHELGEAALTTVEHPLDKGPDAIEAADMEAYYAAKAALKFLPTSRIMVAKTVSDHFSSAVPSKSQVKVWLQTLLEATAPLLEAYQCETLQGIQWSLTLQENYQQLCEHLQLTQSQQHQLESGIYYALLKTGQEPLLPKQRPINHKKEQKDAFSKIIRLLES